MNHTKNNKRNRLTRRGISFLLAFVLMMSAFAPGAAYATDGQPEGTPEPCTICNQTDCDGIHCTCAVAPEEGQEHEANCPKNPNYGISLTADDPVVCETCGGEHETTSCTKCPACKNEKADCTCTPLACETCGGEHETASCTKCPACKNEKADCTCTPLACETCGGEHETAACTKCPACKNEQADCTCTPLVCETCGGEHETASCTKCPACKNEKSDCTCTPLVCETCGGEHETADCTKCPACKNEQADCTCTPLVCETCGGEHETASCTKCPGDDTCTIEGCPNHKFVCEICKGPHGTENCHLCPDCKEDPCICDPVCLTCGGDHETWNCPENIPIAYAADDSSPADGLTISKTATKKLENDEWNGSYDLELTLNGSVGTAEENQKVDLLIVIDRSDSMRLTDGTSQTRLEHAKDARNELIKTLEDSKKPGTEDEDQFQYNIVDFSGYGCAPDFNAQGINEAEGTVDSSGWGNATNAKNHAVVIDRTYPSTNYEAAFREVNEQLANAREDALKVVVFLTDGKPTVAWTKIGIDLAGLPGYWGYGSSVETSPKDNVPKCMEAAEDELKLMKADRFYIVGIGTAEEFVGETKTTVLDSVYAAATQISPENKKIYTPGTSGLVDQFKNIGTMLTEQYYSNVTITDELDPNVQVKDDATVMVRVEDANGTTIVGPDKSVSVDGATLTAGISGNKLSLNFPDDYKLNPAYTYILSAVIEPTETAYREYRTNNEQYTDTPDSGTGTHADNNREKGFRSNTKANVSFSYGGETYDGGEGNGAPKLYPHPVVQLTPGKLTITKSFVGLTEDQIKAINDLSFNVDLTYPDDGTDDPEKVTKTVNFTQMKDEDNDGIYTYTITGLSPETQYSVTESGGSVNGYPPVVTSENTTGTVPKGENRTASFVNAYTTALTIGKTVTGNMGDLNLPFAFTVTIGDREETFNLKHGESKELTGIPVGASVTVTEITAGYTASYTLNGGDSQAASNGSMTFTVNDIEPDIIQFTNNKTATIDTGVVLDSMPYIIILAGVAAVGLFQILRRRNRYED